MRSRSDAGPAVALAAVLTAALSLGVAAVQEPARAGAGRPGRTEIARAIETIKADPNLATERTIKTLHWNGATRSSRSRLPPWLAWMLGLFRWLEQSARLLVWVGAAALAAALVVYIMRTVRGHRLPRGDELFVAPTHVRDLDIRPESLPEDVGAAARHLWDRGEHRAALALLYRGMLSRLAHVHHIPIRDSTTEGDCLALAASHLTLGKREYASRLVRVWQGFVYGARPAQAATVYVLCDDFGSALGPASPLDVMAPGDTA